MKKALYIVKIIVAGMFLIHISGCTWNPFGDDDISSGHRQIHGTVRLHDGSSPEGVYVWLEVFNVGTYTDQAGQFTIILPSGSSQGSSGLSGIYNLYFYIANYKLSTAQVVVREGEFLYSRGEINKDGKLTAPKVLSRFLWIETTVNPSSVAANYTGNIDVNVALTAIDDSATVIVPKSLGDKWLGAILLKKTDSQGVLIYKSVPFATTQLTVLVGSITANVNMTFTLILKPLLPGNYEIIPYLLIAHETIPEDLFESIGLNARELSQDYLNIPFKREGGEFEVR